MSQAGDVYSVNSTVATLLSDASVPRVRMHARFNPPLPPVLRCAAQTCTPSGASGGGARACICLRGRFQARKAQTERKTRPL